MDRKSKKDARRGLKEPRSSADGSASTSFVRLTAVMVAAAVGVIAVFVATGAPNEATTTTATTTSKASDTAQTSYDPSRLEHRVLMSRSLPTFRAGSPRAHGDTSTGPLGVVHFPHLFSEVSFHFRICSGSGVCVCVCVCVWCLCVCSNVCTFVL